MVTNFLSHGNEKVNNEDSEDDSEDARQM